MDKKREKLLLKKAQSGDVKAFETLLTEYQNHLFSFALNITGGNDAISKDVLQEALIKSFVNIEKFRGTSSFSSWLWRIVKNEFINYTKSAKTRNHILIDDISTIPSAVEENSENEIFIDERKKNLRKLISTLPMIYQEALTLIDFQEISYVEAAKIADVSVGTIKSRIFTAREKLAEAALSNKELFI